MGKQSNFLYASPSFIEGIARTIDLGNTLSEYNYSNNPDEIALYMDWAVIGNDIRKAMILCAKDLENKNGSVPR